eukprot:TRINITY_DN6721_c0_g1_i1.p1 TRINITY_DN6721_c0_g1~~TRINITY_DN6721_c0_g1_i1.p1  ORF type:complete len:397 (-),score=25.58 TRINITY_DN6721_c0_g1_i1:64-1179(-)
MALPAPTFAFTRDGVEVASDQVLRVLDWSGVRQEVYWTPHQFRIRNNSTLLERTEPVIQYLSWDDQKMIAQFDGVNFATQPAAARGTTMIVDKTLRYKSWDGSRWTASTSTLSSSMMQPGNAMLKLGASTVLHSGWSPASSLVASTLPSPSYAPQNISQSSNSSSYPPQLQSPSFISAPHSSVANPAPRPYPSAYPPVQSLPYSSPQPQPQLQPQPQPQLQPQPQSYSLPWGGAHSAAHSAHGAQAGGVLQSFYRFKHQRQFSNASHEDVVLHYKTWDDTDWTARLANGSFYVTRGGQPIGHTDSIVNYRAWDGSNWTARLTMQDGQPAFYHVKQYATNGHTDKALQYKTWDGSCWMTTLVPDPSLAPYLK